MGMWDLWKTETHTSKGFTTAAQLYLYADGWRLVGDSKMQRVDQLKDQLQRLQKNRSNIRNICILAHVDHG